jgi:hypothetical protein
VKPLGPAVLLTARPRARLFHLVFGSHIGRALGADSGEKSGLASDIDTATVESLNALDPKRPIREAVSFTVESPGGISPLGAPRTVHDPLESHGSRCSAVAMTQCPMSKERWVGPA